jgi:predicted TIM-barrel fold metal-dependent hydrolase
MDAAGVATSILSMSTPGSWFGSVEDGRRMSREINEYAAGMGRDHPGRFGLFAAIPLPDTEGSLKEIEYAMGTLKADGIGLMTSYDTVPLGDKQFAPVFDELNRRKAVILIHRTAATCCLNLRQLPGNQEFVVDDLRMLNSLLTSGTIARYPDIRWIHAHGDKVVPWVAKLNGAPLNGPGRGGDNPPWAPQGVQNELKKIYVDSAGNAKYTMDELRKLGVLTSRVMFGTDVPYGTVGNNLTNLRNAMGLSQAEIEAVEYQTARRLFPRLNA